MEPLRNDDFYKSLYFANTEPDIGLTEYNGYKKFGLSDNEALDTVKRMYRSYPNNYYVYGGQLPETIITPDKNARNDVVLTTYYPVTSRYWATGHSRLDTPGGNTIDVMSDDPDYNLLLNNCSDETRKALEQATGKRINPWFFTTPGDVKSFAENVLGGKSFNNDDGTVETYINLPQYQINKIAKYAQGLRQKKILRARQNAEIRRKRKLAMAGPYKNIE